MAISMKELSKLTTVDKVTIHSIDLSMYIVSVWISGREHYVVDKHQRPLTSHNKLELQALFERKDVGAMVLRHQSAYDEMVGQPLRDTSNELEVPLGNRELGGSKTLRR